MTFSAPLPPVLLAALFLALPFLSSQRFFTILVPSDWRSGPTARRIRFQYQLVIVLIAVISAFVSMRASGHSAIVYTIPVLEVFALLAAWAWGWNRTVPARLPHAVVRSASLGPRNGEHSSLAWTAAAVLPLLASTFILATHLSAIPQTFPIHFDSAGHANHWATRSNLTVFGPIVAGTVLILLLVALLHAVSSRGAGLPDGGRYSSITRYVFIGCAWFLSLEVGAVALLPLSVHPATVAGRLVMLSSALLLLLLLASFGLLYRQRASLPAAQAATAEEFWKGGLWYYNPNDAALFVPKRIGFGYTLNMAHPEAWLLIAATLVVAALPLVLKHL